MKTTIELPDALFRQAKAAAATRGITLRQLMTEAVQMRLRADAAEDAPSWRELHGALSSLHRETRRIQERIDDEFERVDEDDAG